MRRANWAMAPFAARDTFTGLRRTVGGQRRNYSRSGMATESFTASKSPETILGAVWLLRSSAEIALSYRRAGLTMSRMQASMKQLIFAAWCDRQYGF